jgi:CRP-like cAMP-binding protein
MSMIEFLKYLNDISSLSLEAICDIKASLINVKLKKKKILIHEMSKSEYLYFIKKGILRAFFYHNGKEITDWFGIENMVVGPIIRSFPIKETSHKVEALEDCELIGISFKDLENLYQKHHDVERLGRLIAIQTVLHLQYKIDSLQLFTAKERYDDFLKRYPELLNRVSLGYISSYLGMNQVTLSRIRKTI